MIFDNIWRTVTPCAWIISALFTLTLCLFHAVKRELDSSPDVRSKGRGENSVTATDRDALISPRSSPAFFPDLGYKFVVKYSQT